MGWGQPQAISAIPDEGRREGAEKERRESELRIRRQTLLQLLRRRFGAVPPEVVRTVESTQDVEQLVVWLDRVVTAASLDEAEAMLQANLRSSPPARPAPTELGWSAAVA